MVNNNRVPVRAWRCTALARVPVCIAWISVACSSNPSSSGAGGASGRGGASGSGSSGSGGVLGGGASGTNGASGAPGGSGGLGGGDASSAGSSGSGGVSGSGGSGGGGTGGSGAGSGGSGGSTGGGSGGSGAIDAGGGGSAGAVPSAGCGKTSTITFASVPGEPPNGFGTGGYVTIQSSGQSRGFALRLPDNYDRNRPYRLIFGFHWNGGTSKDVDTGGSNGYSMAHFGLQALSKNGAIFVAPQGSATAGGTPEDKTCNSSTTWSS